MCSNLSLWQPNIRSVTSWESLDWLSFLISLVFVWSIQPGCLSLSCKIIITPTNVYDQKLNYWLMWSNVTMIIAADKCAQIFPYDTPDQIPNDNNCWHSCQLSNDAVINQQFHCWWTLHDRSVLSFRHSWSCPPVVATDRCYWPTLQCWQVWSLAQFMIHLLY